MIEAFAPHAREFYLCSSIAFAQNVFESKSFLMLGIKSFDWRELVRALSYYGGAYLHLYAVVAQNVLLKF